MKMKSKKSSILRGSWSSTLRIFSLVIAVECLIVWGYFEFERVIVPKIQNAIRLDSPQQLKPPIISSITRLDKPNRYLVTGFAEAGAFVTFRGVETEDDYLFNTWNGLQTAFIDPTNRIFQAEIKLRINEPLIINTMDGRSRQEGNSPVVIEAGKVEQFAVELTPIITKYVFTISSEGIQTEIIATGTTNSPPFSILLADKTRLNAFIHLAVGDVSINDGNWIFYGEQLPDINIEDGNVTVHAQSGPFPVGAIRPIGISELRIQSRDYPLVRTRNIDELQVTIKDYSVLSISPPPSFIDGDTYTWKEIQPDEVIELRVNQDLSSQLRALPSFPISFIVEGYVANILGFAADLFVASIMIALLWLNSKAESLKLPKENVLQRAQSIIMNCGALYLVPPIYYLASSLVSRLWRQSRLNTIRDSFENFLASEGVYDFYGFATILAILVVVIMVSYITWLIAPRFRYARQAFIIVSRAGIYLLILGVVDFLLDRVGINMPLNTFMNYAVWLLSAILLTIFGFALLNNIMWLVNRYEEGNKPSRIPRIVLIVIRFLIPVLALRVTFAAITPQNYYLFSDPMISIVFMLSRMSDGVIYYSAFGAMMIAVLLAKEHSWKWDFDHKELKDSILRLHERKWHERERFWLLLGSIMFAGYLVGVSNSILSIPISAIFAWIVFPYMLVSQEKVGQLAFYADRVYAERTQLLNQLANDLALDKLKAKLESLQVNLSRGKINPSEYDQSVAILQKEIDQLENARSIKDIYADDFALAFGPEKRPLDNAFFGAKWAFLLQILLLILLFNSRVLDRGDYPWVYLIVAQFVFIMRWVIIGFFFGLFYEYIRGNNGIRKALTLTLGFLFSILPYRLIKGGDVQAVIVEIVLFVFLILMLGVIFDKETLQRHGFSISYLRVVTSDFTSLAYVFSLLVPVITIIVPTLITGQFGQILTLIVEDILPVLTNIPGQH